MQAVIPAAGQSSRMVPFTGYVHKSLMTICGKTILEHTIESIKNAGITDILLVVSNSALFEQALDKKNLSGVNIRFVEMKEPTGAGDALLLAKPFITDSFFLINPSRVDFFQFAKQMERKLDDADGVLLGCEVENPEKYGILQIENDLVKDIVEKPEKEDAPSNIRAVGVYLFGKQFLNVLEKTPKSHYSLEHAIASFAKKHALKVAVVKESPPSEKYAWDLLALKNSILETQKPRIAETACVAMTAVVDKNAIIEDGAQVFDYAVIKGRCYIGRNAFVGTRAIVRDGTCLEENAVAGANLEVKNSLVLENVTTHNGFIGDSVIGRNTKIAAGFISGNVRLDRKNISVFFAEKKIDTGLRDLGCVVGSDCKIGIRVSTMPGVVIGNNSIVGPGTTVLHNVASNAKYYTTFEEIVEENQTLNAKSQKPLHKVILFDIDYTLFDTNAFKQSNLKTYKMYEEVEEVLAHLENVTIGIFSEGVLDFQKAKLFETNIHEHFSEEHIHIIEKKEEALAGVLQKYADDDLYLVDDKLPLLFAAKKIQPLLTTIWVKRGVYAEKQEPILGFTPDATVDNLRDIIPIITCD